jgi:mono/diheme cytochrome c family protein
MRAAPEPAGTGSFRKIRKEAHAPIMKKIKYLTILSLVAGAVSAQAQAPAKGDPKKGKTTFDQQCSLCHDATTTEQKMGPGLKGLFKRPKLATNGKPINDANVLDKINNGGNTMTPFKDLLSDSEKADLMAYLKTI